MRYIAWKLERVFGFLLRVLVLYPVKLLLFIPAQLDFLATAALCRLRR